MKKLLVVANEVQKQVLIQVMLNEIVSGKWKHERPAGHAEAWEGVEIVVGEDLGPHGWTVPRNYDFGTPALREHVNTETGKTVGQMMMDVALTVNPHITEKALIKHMFTLNRIVGGRLKRIDEKPVILNRGQNKVKENIPTAVVKRVAATSK